jgi:hypothetical protein
MKLLSKILRALLLTTYISNSLYLIAADCRQALPVDCRQASPVPDQSENRIYLVDASRGGRAYIIHKFKMVKLGEIPADKPWTHIYQCEGTETKFIKDDNNKKIYLTAQGMMDNMEHFKMGNSGDW